MPDLKSASRTPDRAENKSENIQDLFLNNARRDRSLVTLYLMTGAKLTGKIRSFDKFSLILESNHQEQLIFKHAIATISAQGHSGGGANGGTQARGGNFGSEANTSSEG